MATCDICKRKLGFGGGTTLYNYNSSGERDFYNITVCSECANTMQALKKGSVDAYIDIHSKIDGDKPGNTHSFVRKWEADFLEQHPELNEGKEEELKIQREKEQKEAQLESIRQRANTDETFREIAISKMQAEGRKGYYEYAVRTSVDERGRTDVKELVSLLNEMGLAGWLLVTSHTNEMGKNALLAYGLGINSTADETVLIFERYVEIG